MSDQQDQQDYQDYLDYQKYKKGDAATPEMGAGGLAYSGLSQLMGKHDTEAHAALAAKPPLPDHGGDVVDAISHAVSPPGSPMAAAGQALAPKLGGAISAAAHPVSTVDKLVAYLKGVAPMADDVAGAGSNLSAFLTKNNRLMK